MKELQTKSTSALKWNILDQGMSQIMQFATNIFLIRILDPQIFGLFALPFVALSFVRTFQDLGMSNFIVKEKDIDDRNLRSIFGFILVSGLCFFMISFFAVPYIIEDWMDENTNLWVMRSLSIIVLIYAPAIYFETLLRKKLDFKSLYFMNFGATLGSCLLGIFLAIDGHGVWSLVGKQVSYFGIFAIGSYLLTNKEERIRPNFRFAEIEGAVRYSLDVSKEEVMNFAIKNADSLLIGRYLSANQLGIYDRGLRLLTMPVQQLSGSLNKVLFPTMSLMAVDKETTKHAFSVALKSISLLITPSMFFIYFMAEEVVALLFGLKWVHLIPLIKIFSLLAIVQSITMLATNVFYVYNETKKMLRFSYWSKSLLLIGFIVGAVYFQDMIILAWIYLVISALTAIPYLNLVAKMMGERGKVYFVDILRYGFYSLVAIIPIMTIKEFFWQQLSNFTLLIISFSLVSIVYFIILVVTKDEMFARLGRLVRTRNHRKT